MSITSSTLQNFDQCLLIVADQLIAILIIYFLIPCCYLYLPVIFCPLPVISWTTRGRFFRHIRWFLVTSGQTPLTVICPLMLLLWHLSIFFWPLTVIYWSFPVISWPLLVILWNCHSFPGHYRSFPWLLSVIFWPILDGKGFKVLKSTPTYRYAWMSRFVPYNLWLVCRWSIVL